ncbi:winged helix-turn-helix domain-containing protein [Cellvibrio sp.]|uniref:winged helix-turn-helix domain-containing protein n=1 Tax=Cellvibrio sp. TaxID=1965322 RepID=UPI003964849D
MKISISDKFSFDKIVVDPKSNTIYLNGLEKRLEPKLISLLCLLAAQGRDVISRQDITEAIWPDVVVGEESITRAIFALRNALGDDAKQPKYIETIPKKGYRFLADVDVPNETPNIALPEGDVSVSPGKSTRYIYFVGLVLLIIAGFVGLSRHEKPSMEIESILPLNKMEGVERSISLSADAKRLLFVHESDNTNDLYSRDLQDAKDSLWVSDEFVKWSPVWIDENTIAYVRRHGGEIQILRNYRDQPPQVLYVSHKPILQLAMLKGDSENLFFLEFQNNELIELKSLNLRNGKQQNWRDLIPELPNKISQLQYSTQSGTLLALKDQYESPTVVALDLNKKVVVPVERRFSEIRRLAAINDSSILVVGTIGATEGIWLVVYQKAPQLVLRSSGSEEIFDVQIDVDKKIIFYANLQKNTDVETVSVATQEISSLPELNSSGIDTNARFANQNKLVYFVSNRTGYYDIWVYDVESKSVRQVSNLNALSISSYAISHDGKRVAIGYRASDLYLGVVDSETGKLLNHVKTPSHRHPLAWSYDDKNIYASEHQTVVNLFNYDSVTLMQSLFAEKSGLYVKALDDTSLIYVDYQRHALVERNLKTHQENVLHDAIPDLLDLVPGKIKLNKVNDGFYSSCQVERAYKTCLFSLSATKKDPVVVSNISRWQMYDITEDGETMLVEDVKPSSGDIMKMQLRD